MTTKYVYINLLEKKDSGITFYKQILTKKTKMKELESLQKLIDLRHLGLLSTLNIQIIEKKLTNETIEFPYILIKDQSCVMIRFNASELVDMKFIHTNFSQGEFYACLVKQCFFADTLFKDGNITNCVFRNCLFISCTFFELYAEKTTFDGCVFVSCYFDASVFDSCHFLKPIFEKMEGYHLVSSGITDCKFSNSQKSIEFEGDVFFIDVFDQIKKLRMEEE